MTTWEARTGEGEGSLFQTHYNLQGLLWFRSQLGYSYSVTGPEVKSPIIPVPTQGLVADIGITASIGGGSWG